MRISDWSSDVCSSDLPGPCREGFAAQRRRGGILTDIPFAPRLAHHIAERLRRRRPDTEQVQRNTTLRPRRGIAANRSARGRVDDRVDREAVIGRDPRIGVAVLILGFAMGVIGIPGPSTADFALQANDAARSEEHTSDLQSLMRTSYADICWNKNTR